MTIEEIIEALRHCAACNCHGCPYHGRTAGSCAATLKCNAADAIEALVRENEALKQAHREWVSVKERLPDGKCIAGCFDRKSCDYGEMIIGYVGKFGNEIVAEDDGNDLSDITHWMPKPEPPEVE